MNYYIEIKNKLINNEITKRVKNYSINKSDLTTYYNVGKLLFEAGKHYGEGIIKEYSKKLTSELGKGYSVTNLKYMRQFYLFQKGQPVADQLNWSHYQLILPLKNESEIAYYLTISKKYNLTKRELRERIKSREYERLSFEAKKKIINDKDTSIKEIIPNPIVIKRNKNIEKISERVLQQIILEDIPSFLHSLGTGFTFIENEYRIKIGSNYNYIDLLLFNYEFNCFVVVELKITELKKEHIGQIHVYMNYIDKNIKKINQNKTIGIILVRKNNEFILEYSSDKRIIARTYQLF